MEQKNRTVFVILTGIIIVIAMFSAFGLTIFSGGTSKLQLPDLSESNDDSGAETASVDSSYIPVEVTPETVQNVVSTLSRWQSYYRTISLTTYSGNWELKNTVQVWVVDDWTRVKLSSTNQKTQHRIVGAGMLYLWYDGDTAFQSFPANDEESDIAQHIPTYEDIQTFDSSDITDAKYETITLGNDTYDCIYVEAVDPDLGYLNRYWVAVTNGLLIAAETLKDDVLLQQMSSETIVSPAGSDADFTLPDGSMPQSFGD